MKLGAEDLSECLGRGEVPEARAEDGGVGPTEDAKRTAGSLAAMTFDERATVAAIRQETGSELVPIDDFPAYVPEEKDEKIVVKGRWLERGGSAWWISTAGTGKSIASVQLAFSMAAGLPFCGLEPNVVNGRTPRFWVIQSEDSPTRVAIDRDDITAELAERHPDVDWAAVRRRVMFLKIRGKVGADFLEELEKSLKIARKHGQSPDVIIINPFLAYIGGPVTDGAYVTPFLRGGIINRGETKGLQYLLETYDVAALIFHHTPKPPSAKEIDEWIRSPFPEYQGAGSADITNWGRSFVTMMRVKDRKNMVMVTAGKNGSELGWEVVDGATRRFLAYSSAKGVTGRGRHAWRELTDEEYSEVTKTSNDNRAKDVAAIADALKEAPMTPSQVRERFSKSMTERRYRSAWEEVCANHDAHGIACVKATRGRTSCWFYGTYDEARKAADEWSGMTDF